MPLLKAKLGEAYQRTSAAFIWSYIDRMYKARRSGMKREMFGYVPAVINAFSRRSRRELEKRGVEILTASPVTNVEYDGIDQQLKVTCGSGDNQRTLAFDRVVNTAPSPIISHSCPSAYR